MQTNQMQICRYEVSVIHSLVHIWTRQLLLTAKYIILYYYIVMIWDSAFDIHILLLVTVIALLKSEKPLYMSVQSEYLTKAWAVMSKRWHIDDCFK